MSTRPDPFQRAHADALKAVHLFLPSLTNRNQGQPQEPDDYLSKHPLEPIRSLGIANTVEAKARRIARGLPPEPTPEQQFGNVLDEVHTRALQTAIAAHPEEERSRLISEAHDSATKWIMSHNGKVVVHGKVELAHSPQSAQELAKKIVNGTVEEHDQRTAAAVAGVPESDGSSKGDGGGFSQSPAGASVQRPDTQPMPGSQPSATPPNVPGTPEVVLPGGDKQITPTGPPPTVSGREIQKVGSRKADGHQITQPKNSIESNQKLAMDAAPELHQALSGLTQQVPGLTYDRIRPQKDTSRLDQKVEDENAPNTLSDYLGAQIAADSPQAKDALIGLLKKNFKVIEIDDHFLKPREDKAGYPSANVQVQLSNGMTAEVQIVPREVQERTEESHKFYKAGRDAEEKGDNEERDRQWDQARQIHAEALDRFNARNGDAHAPLRQSLESAGVKPVKLGGKLFYPLDAEPEAPDAQQG